MFDLDLQTGVLLFAKFELEVHNLLLLTQVRYHRSELKELRGSISICVGFVRWRKGRRICRLFDSRSLRGDLFEMLMEERIMCGKILTSTTR
jgi:hypothetical protein